MAKQPSSTENLCDISGEMLSPAAQRHTHPVNAGVHPGTAKPDDFQQAKNVPARATRERVDPGTANAQRRKPLIDVTSIESPAGKASEGDDYARHAAHSSTATPTPRKL